MVYSSIGGSALRHVHQCILPRSFCRYKSITAAIERGRHDGQERSFRPRTETDRHYDRERPLKTRRDARFERFGPPRDDAFSKEDSRRPISQTYTSGRVNRSRPHNDDVPSEYRRDRPQRSWEERPRNGYNNNVRGRFGVEQSPRRWEDRSPRTGSDRNRRFEADRPPRNTYNAFSRFGGQGPSRKREKDPESMLAQGSSDESKKSLTDGEAVRYRNMLDKLKSPWTKAGYNRVDKRGILYTVKPDAVLETKDGAEAGGSASTRGPASLPYTTAASEFLYGHSSVLAAIKANRRTFYKLYTHARATENTRSILATIRSRKLFHIVVEVGDEYMRAMDKASNGRPHNGLILEASPPPILPITQLKAASIEDGAFSLLLDSQSAEDEAINGKQELHEYKSEGWRYPLILYVDGVVDEGNLGAIARSAYVLGVDGIITPTHHTAEWTSIAVKASAGAAEAIPLFRVRDAEEFLQSSSRTGWRLYASDAVPSSEKVGRHVVYAMNKKHSLPVSADHCPVAEHPTILMMGSEHAGLRRHLRSLAHYKVGIPHGRSVDEVGVDSFNVSVAAGILCYQMMQRRQPTAERDPKGVLF